MQKTILSTADIARLFNVTETTVKRWADEGTLRCQKTPGGHRKFEMRFVVQFAEENKLEPVGTLALPDSDRLGTTIQVALLSRDFASLVRVFVEKALSPDRLDLYAFLSYLYEHKIQLWEIYDLIVRPGMEEIGNRWVRGEIGINHEHRASYETLDALAKLQAEIMIKPPSGKTAMFACLGEELHEIGLRCASYVFESEGWNIQYFGARTPVDSLVPAVREVRPEVLCLSLTTPPPGSDVERIVGLLHSTVHEKGGLLIAGGYGASADFVERKSADFVFSSARELNVFLEHAHHHRPTAVGLH